MLIKEVIACLEQNVPPALAAEWDSVGLMVGSAGRECTGVLLALDCTLAVARQAPAEKRNLIITHHPLIFRPIGVIDCDTPQGKVLELLIENGIAVYAAHTNLDVCADGIGRNLALALGGSDPISIGFGYAAEILPTTLGGLAARARKVLGDPTVTVSGDPNRRISSIYVVPGAGGDSDGLAAARAHADALITAEVKHSIYVEASNADYPVVGISHYYGELGACECLERALSHLGGACDIKIANQQCPYRTLEEI